MHGCLCVNTAAVVLPGHCCGASVSRAVDSPPAARRTGSPAALRSRWPRSDWCRWWEALRRVQTETSSAGANFAATQVLQPRLKCLSCHESTLNNCLWGSDLSTAMERAAAAIKTSLASAARCSCEGLGRLRPNLLKVQMCHWRRPAALTDIRGAARREVGGCILNVLALCTPWVCWEGLRFERMIYTVLRVWVEGPFGGLSTFAGMRTPPCTPAPSHQQPSQQGSPPCPAGSPGLPWLPPSLSTAPSHGDSLCFTACCTHTQPHMVSTSPRQEELRHHLPGCYKHCVYLHFSHEPQYRLGKPQPPPDVPLAGDERDGCNQSS